jgi:Holliday junction resolvase RusA-like endonuclease
MTRIITLTIPQASPSLNSTTRRHWRVYYRQKKLWQTLIMVAKSQAGVYGRPLFERAKVNIERHGVKLCDVDNLIGGTKVCTDSLRALGLIVDDSPWHIELTVTQRISKEPKTVITIEDLAGQMC